jgi:glycerol kinase
VYRGIDELVELWAVERTFHPLQPRERALERMALWERAVRQTVAV